MSNMPEVKIGVVAVSRDCFPESLSVNRRKNLMKAYTDKYGAEEIYECPICIVESEIHMVQGDVRRGSRRDGRQSGARQRRCLLWNVKCKL